MDISISTREQEYTGVVLSEADITITIDGKSFHPDSLFQAQRIRNHVANPDKSGAEVALELLETGHLTPIDTAL